MTVIQLRRGTATQWSTANPILALGEAGVETDTQKIKFGDGVSTWTALPYGAQTDISGKSDVGHKHPVADISDSTTVGRNVVTAADALAARNAIGAGTSNLVIGTTSTTAMRGDKTYGFAEITGTVGTAQLPPLAISEPHVVASETAMLGLVAQRGDVAIRTDINKSFILAADAPATLSNWKELFAAGSVISVAGKTGAVLLAKADVGLGSVDNTTDLNKPVSNATQTALNDKANTSHTHGSADILAVDGGAP